MNDAVPPDQNTMPNHGPNHVPNQLPGSALSRRGWLSAGLGLAGLALLPPARACEFQTATLRVTHPYCLASAPGSSEAVVCMKFDEVSRDDRLIGVQMPLASGAVIAGAQARPRVDFEIPAGQETWLSERGTWLLLTGLSTPLSLGRTYPLQLEFEHGGIVLAQLSVDYPAARFL